jgi:restriction endonuclease S subunit
LVFNKEFKRIQCKYESIFNKWSNSNWWSVCRRMKTNPYLSPCTKLKSKWMKELNIKPDILNLVEEEVGKSLKLIGTGEIFLNRTPVA